MRASIADRCSVVTTTSHEEKGLVIVNVRCRLAFIKHYCKTSGVARNRHRAFKVDYCNVLVETTRLNAVDRLD